MAKKQKDVQFGLCIDWETSGATWGKDSWIDWQGISFGAIIFNAKTFEPIEELYLEIKYDPSKGWGWSSEAQAIHGLTQEYLEANGVTQEEAAMALAELILKYWGTDGQVMVLGHNTEFDIGFSNQLFNQIGIEFSVNPTGKFDSHIAIMNTRLDTSGTGFIALGLYKSDLLFEAVGCADRGAHNALEDARNTLQTCQVIRALVEAVMASLNG